jgi:membrane glycosyltransferase
MCPKDMVESPVGYKCRECGRAKITKGGVKPRQLALALAFSLVTAAVAAPVARFIPFLFLGAILYGGAVGEAARRGGGGHRTWEFAAIAGVCALAGALSVALYGRLDLVLVLVGPVVAAVYVTSARWFG